MTFLDELEEDSALDAPTSAVEVVTPPSSTSKSVAPALRATGHLTPEEQVESALREMENTIFEQAMDGVMASQKWPEIAKELDPKDEKEIPPKWIAEYGMERARNMYRVARASLMPTGDAPVGLKQNVQLVTGIMKARSNEQRGPKILNMTLVEMPNVTVNFPEKEVKESK